MSVTPKQIAKLTDRHKIVAKYTGAPEHVAPVTLELWTDENGTLRDSVGVAIRWSNGTPAVGPALIIDIIEPPHEFKYGDVIGKPSATWNRAVFLPTGDDGGLQWLSRNGWQTQEWADEQLANGWVIDPDGKQGR